jgi:choline dehydrogenase
LFGAFFDAVQEAGYPLTEDVNGYRQEGFAKFDRNIRKGRRLSAARAYLHPVMNRPNLEVRTRTFVERVVFEGTRAVGVRVNGETIRAGEVILCGGAINSPQLLQLSGIGNASELEALGVGVVKHLPGVGENLQDHLEVYVQCSSKLPVTVAPAYMWRNRPLVGLKWLLFKSGPGATNHFEAGGFIRSNDEVAYPNVMFHFLPIAVRYDGTAPQGHGYQLHVGPMYSDARGSVKITSTDPNVHPALRFNYLSTDQDRREWVECVRAARSILNQPAFDRRGDPRLGPARRGDRAAPVVHREDGRRRARRRRPGDDARPWRRRAARRGRERLPLRDEREHLRAGDDGRREGCRSHPRQHTARSGGGGLLPS